MSIDEKYKAIKKRLGLNDEDVAQMFGYANANSLRTSGQGRERLIRGIVELYEAVVNHLKLEQ